MKIDIQGKVVEVDDSFKQLSPDDQAAAVEDIAKQMGIHAEAKKEVEAEVAAGPTFRQEHPTVSGITDTAVGILPLAWDAANQIAGSPVGKALEAAGLGYGGYKGLKSIGESMGRGQAATGTGPAAPSSGAWQRPPAPVAPQIQVPQNVGSGPRPQPNIGTAQQTFETLKQPAPRMAPVAPEATQMARGAAQGAQAVAPEANWMTRAVSMGEQAMAKAAPAARGIADLAARYNPALVGAQLATYSPTLGPRVPQSGPYRGMEINPRTGRPWSPEELNAIASGRY